MRSFGADFETEVRERLGGTVVEAIEQAHRSAWLPLQYDVELSRHVAEVGGRSLVGDSVVVALSWALLTGGGRHLRFSVTVMQFVCN